MVMYFSNYYFCDVLKKICWEPIAFNLLIHFLIFLYITFRYDLLSLHMFTTNAFFEIPILMLFLFSQEIVVMSPFNTSTILITVQINLDKYSSPIVLKV